MAKNEKRFIFGLILSCWLSYMFSMCMKMAYSASIVEIQDEYLISSNVIASLPLTLHYFLYALIQLFLVVLVEKINMKRYMLVTFVFSGLSFVSVFFYSPFWYVSAVFALNGITLGAVWCGSVMMFGKYLSPKTMNGALLFMGVGFSAGSALSFGVSSLVMRLGNWRISFIVFGSAFLVSSLYMLFSVFRAEKAGIRPAEEPLGEKPQIYQADKISSKYMLIMSTAAMFFLNILVYAFVNWTPRLLKSVYDYSNDKATLVSMFIPILGYFGQISAAFVSNRIKNDFITNGTISAAITVISLVLCFAFSIDVILTVAIILLLNLFSRGLDTCFGSLTSLHVRQYYNSGATSALTNSSACIAAAVSPFLIGLILDLSGGNWKTGFLALFGFAAITFSICFAFYLLNTLKHREEKTTH